MIKIIIIVGMLSGVGYFFLGDYFFSSSQTSGISVTSVELDGNDIMSLNKMTDHDVAVQINNEQPYNDEVGKKNTATLESEENISDEQSDSLNFKPANNPDEFGNERTDYDDSVGMTIGEYIPLMESEITASISEYEAGRRNAVTDIDTSILPEDVMSSDVESGSEIGEFISTEQLSDNSITVGEVIGVDIPADIEKIQN